MYLDSIKAIYCKSYSNRLSEAVIHVLVRIVALSAYNNTVAVLTTETRAQEYSY
jgi:hypothetical protein